MDRPQIQSRLLLWLLGFLALLAPSHAASLGDLDGMGTFLVVLTNIISLALGAGVLALTYYLMKRLTTTKQHKMQSFPDITEYHNPVFGSSGADTRTASIVATSRTSRLAADQQDNSHGSASTDALASAPILEAFSIIKRLRWEAIPTGVPLCREDKEQADTLDRLYTLLEKYMLVNKVQKSDMLSWLPEAINKLQDDPTSPGGSPARSDATALWLREVYFDGEKRSNNARRGSQFLMIGGGSGHSSFANQLPPQPQMVVSPFSIRPEHERYLQHMGDWSFDIFAFNEVAAGQPLLVMTWAALERLGLFQAFDIPPTRCHAMLQRMETTYSDSYNSGQVNPYHNSLHAADVVQACYHFITHPELVSHFTDLERLGIIVAAMIHDYRHRGVTNSYLIKAEDEIALRYNDESPLENMHVSEAFRLMRSPQFSVFAALMPQQYKMFRRFCIQLVLATDIATHFNHLGKCKLKLDSGKVDWQQDSDRLMVATMMIKMADLSHPAKEHKIHTIWTKRLSEEYFLQGDREKVKYGPEGVSALCDRSNSDIPSNQIGFIDFLVRPMVSIIATLLGTDMYSNMMENNYKAWKAQQLQSKRSGSELQSGQMTVAVKAGAPRKAEEKDKEKNSREKDGQSHSQAQKKGEENKAKCEVEMEAVSKQKEPDQHAANATASAPQAAQANPSTTPNPQPSSTELVKPSTITPSPNPNPNPITNTQSQSHTIFLPTGSRSATPPPHPPSVSRPPSHTQRDSTVKADAISVRVSLSQSPISRTNNSGATH